MKKLTLIRHAKSDWSDASLDDYDRPLNKRGLRDAPFMAELLLKQGWLPQVFFTSTAERALSTATIFVNAIDPSKNVTINTDPDIYLAAPTTLMSVIGAFPNNWNHIALVGHNPGLTELTNFFLEDDGYLDNLPTCGVVEIIGGGIGKWSDLLPENAEVKEIHFPKKYRP